tara:strand:+ start:22 stop:537 length:516 start_codon:yes stop_codon:yes gene_type:complete
VALSKIDISKAGITGTLAAANGGTGATSYSPGKVLQVVTATTTSAITSSSTSYVTTGLSADITPSSTSNKVFIMLQGGGAYPTDSVGVTMRVTVYRDTTDLGNGANGIARYSAPGGAWAIFPHSIGHLDSPSSTSEITYTIYYKNADTAGTVQFNDSDRGLPSLTLMEIAG